MPLALPCPTLCFLPHCPRSVNEALVRANWRPGELDRLLLVSNTFETYLLQCDSLVAPALTLPELAPTVSSRSHAYRD